MLFLIVYIACIVAMAGLCAFAAWSDFRRMLIPNIYPLIIIVLFVPAFAASRLGDAGIMGPWQSHLLAAVIVLVISAAMFFFKAIGGGDSKLATAIALWAGLPNLVPFLFYMSLAGVVLSVVTLLVRKFKPFAKMPADSWLGRARAGNAQIPYGIALLAGAIAMFCVGGYFDPEALQRFLL